MGLWVCFVLLIIPSYTVVLAIFNCVCSPSILVYCRAFWYWFIGQDCNCTACALYTCLNHTISYHNASIVLVKQGSELWLPVNLTEPWPDSVFLSVLLKTGLRWCKRIIGWIIAGILSLISIVTVGTLSGMALHNSIQNHDFITAWHKDSQIFGLDKLK